MAIGATASALEELAGEKLRAYLFDYLAKLFAQERLTAIVTPTIGIDVPILSEAAKAVGETDTARSLILTRHVFLGNFIGLPGYSVPIGFLPPKALHPSERKDLKLPVGLQLLGDHWQEHKLIRIAHAIEEGFSSRLPRESEDRTRDFFHIPF